MSTRFNVGCGKDVLEDWINVDLYPSSERVLPGDIRHLSELFGEDRADEIRAIDVLEHIPRKDVLPTLQGWYKLLKSGGTVEIRCPDVREQAWLLVQGTWDTDTWAHMTFGGQDSEGNFHKAGFDEILLVKLLKEAGFEVTKVEPEHAEVPNGGNANFRVWGRKP